MTTTNTTIALSPAGLEYRTCCDHPDCTNCAGHGGFYRMTAQPVAKVGESADAKDAVRYRMLTEGEAIEKTDEFLSSDATSWAADPLGIFAGCFYAPRLFKPARRKVIAIDAAMQSTTTGATDGAEGQS